MERSKYLFEKQGFKVIPFPVDFKISNNELTILDIIPSLGALSKTSLFIRENIGRLYYRSNISTNCSKSLGGTLFCVPIIYFFSSHNILHHHGLKCSQEVVQKIKFYEEHLLNKDEH